MDDRPLTPIFSAPLCQAHIDIKRKFDMVDLGNKKPELNGISIIYQTVVYKWNKARKVYIFKSTAYLICLATS